MAVFTPPFVLPVMAAISSRESPVARNCSNRCVPGGIRSSALLAIISASDCSIGEEASLPSVSHSGYTPLLTGLFLRQSEIQLFFAVDTAQASALRICTPSRLATQSRSSTSCTTSSGSPSSRDARKNFRAVARTFGLIAVSSISSVFSILHRHRRKNRKESSKFSNFFCYAAMRSSQSHKKGLADNCKAFFVALMRLYYFFEALNSSMTLAASSGSLVVSWSTPSSRSLRMSSSLLTVQVLTTMPSLWASSIHSGCS